MNGNQALIQVGDIRALNTSNPEVSSRFVVIFSGPIELNDNIIFRACSISNRFDMIAPDDIHITNKDHLGDEFFIEIWNEFPVSRARIGSYFGNVSALICRKDEATAISLTDDQQKFRQSEIIAFRHLSNELFRELGNQRSRRGMTLSIAASVVILLCTVGLYLANYKSNAALFAQYYKTPELAIDLSNLPDTDQVRGGSCIFQNLNYRECETAIAGLLNYQEGAFENASKRLSSILPSSLKDPFLSFYLAIAYIETEQLAKAVEILAELDEFNDSTIKEQVDYYLAIVLLKNSENKSAREKLREISDSESMYAGDAKEIIRDMRWF